MRTAELVAIPISFNTSMRIRGLIYEIRNLELEIGRNRSYEDLRTLDGVQPHLIDAMLRKVAEARSVDELVVSLDAFAAHGKHNRLWWFLYRLLPGR